MMPLVVCPLCRVQLVLGADTRNYWCPVCMYEVAEGGLTQYVGTSRVYRGRMPPPIMVVMAALELPVALQQRLAELAQYEASYKRDLNLRIMTPSEYQARRSELTEQIDDAITRLGGDGLILRVAGGPPRITAPDKVITMSASNMPVSAPQQRRIYRPITLEDE